MNFQRIDTLDVDEERPKENVVTTMPKIEKKNTTPSNDDSSCKNNGTAMCSHEQDLYAITTELRHRIEDLEKDSEEYRERIAFTMGMLREKKLL